MESLELKSKEGKEEALLLEEFSFVRNGKEILSVLLESNGVKFGMTLDEAVEKYKLTSLFTSKSVLVNFPNAFPKFYDSLKGKKTNVPQSVLDEMKEEEPVKEEVKEEVKPEPIIVPEPVEVKAGSDFDVDKTTVVQKSEPEPVISLEKNTPMKEVGKAESDELSGEFAKTKKK